MRFSDYLNKKTPPSTASAPTAGLPKGFEQILDRVGPVIEKVTGKTMDRLAVEFAVAMTKGQAESYLSNLIPGVGAGTSETSLAKKDQKWLEYAKFAIFWGPLAVLGFGGAVLLLFYFSRFVL